MYQALEAETGAAILHQTKGIFWVAHTEMAMRTERARCQMNTACGKDRDGLPAESRDGPAGGSHGWRSLPGPARQHLEGATARHDRVAWAYARVPQRGVLVSTP
jgi:hypothetical protein